MIWTCWRFFNGKIQNASTTPIDSNQLCTVNTVRWESRHITTQPGESDYRKFEIIPFVIKTGLNVIANNFYIFKTKERSICFVQLKLVEYISTKCLSNPGPPMANTPPWHREAPSNTPTRPHRSDLCRWDTESPDNNTKTNPPQAEHSLQLRPLESPPLSRHHALKLHIHAIHEESESFT